MASASLPGKLADPVALPLRLQPDPVAAPPVAAPAVEGAPAPNPLLRLAGMGALVWAIAFTAVMTGLTVLSIITAGGLAEPRLLAAALALPLLGCAFSAWLLSLFRPAARAAHPDPAELFGREAERIESRLRLAGTASAEAISNALAAADAATQALQQQMDTSMRSLGRESAAATAQVDAALGQIEQMLHDTRASITVQSEALAGALARAHQEFARVFEASDRQVLGFGDDAATVANTLEERWSGIRQQVLADLASLDATTMALAARGQALEQQARQSAIAMAEAAIGLDTQLTTQLGQAQTRLAAMDQAIGSCADRARLATDGSQQQLDALLASLQALDARAPAIDQLADAATRSAAAVATLDGSVAAMQANLCETESRLSTASGTLETATVRIDEAGRALAASLDGQVATVSSFADQLSAALVIDMRRLEQLAEQAGKRAAEAQGLFSVIDAQMFHKTSALLIEKLHSLAIDLAKLFGDDLKDADWQAYLGGDRSLFGRKVARALKSDVRRTLAQQLERDPEFLAAAKSFAGDFELLIASTLKRSDGEPLALTLVSSDLGKLYAALRQALG